MMNYALSLAAVCFAFGVAVWADTITLHDGREFAGTIIVKGDTFTVLTDEKLFQFSRSEVKEYKGEAVTELEADKTVSKPAAGEPNSVIRIKTAKGEILAELYDDHTPNTVANIITLAEAGFYNGMRFHRIIPGFMAQGGCPNSKEGAAGQPGTGGPGYRFADEIEPSLTHSDRGILSMANSGPNTNGSQFFICFTATAHLNGKHTVFGKVTHGMEVLDAIEAIGTPGGRPAEQIEFDIEVVSKRNRVYEVEKL